MDISLFGKSLPLVESMDRDSVLSTPVFDTESAGFLLMEQVGPFGQVGLVKGLFRVHENLLKLIAQVAQVAQVERNI